MVNFNQKLTIDRSSSIPLYKQIKAILIEELQASDNDNRKPFSTEEELVKRFHVSRAPIRQALKELTNEGYVYRERAKGTFPVQDLPVRPPGLELGGLVEYLRDMGLDCNSKILDVDHVLPEKEIRHILQLKPHHKTFNISRVILVKGEPFVWTKTYLVVSEDFNPSRQQLEMAESVFVLLEREQGIFISRGDHQIYASTASDEEADILKIEKDSPVLVMETKLYSRTNQFIGWRRAVHKADEYKLSFTVNR